MREGEVCERGTKKRQRGEKGKVNKGCKRGEGYREEHMQRWGRERASKTRRRQKEKKGREA